MKEIVLAEKEDVIVVVSALGGITDKILHAATNAATGSGDYHTELTEIKTKHEETLQELFNGSGQVKEVVNELLDELDTLDGWPTRVNCRAWTHWPKSWGFVSTTAWWWTTMSTRYSSCLGN